MRRPLASTVSFLACVLSAQASAQDACAIRSDAADVDAIVVSPRGAPPFNVEVRGVPVEARPTASPARVDMRVRGAIAFEGRALELPLRPTRILTLAGGVLALSPDASRRCSRFRASGSRSSRRRT